MQRARESLLTSWWFPPQVSDRRASREIGLLFALGRPFLVLVSLSGVSYLIPGVVPGAGLTAAAWVFALALVIAGCLKLAHLGRYQLGSALLVAVFTVMLTCSVAQFGGLKGPLTMGFLQVLILAGALGGWRSVLRFTGILLGLIALLFFLEQNRYLPAGWPEPVVLVGSATSVALSVVLAAFFLSTSTRALDRALVDAEEHLARAEASEAELQRRIREAPDGYLELDAEGTILAVNPAVERLSGYSASELVGARVQELPGWMDEPARLDVAARVAAPEAEDDVLRASRIRHRGGAVVEVESRARRVQVGSTHRTQVSIRDVTDRNEKERERVRLEAALVDARRLESLGQLAGGVAHDFRNLLTVVLGNAQLLQETLASEPDRGVLVEILDAAERANGLTRQLLTFARKQTHAPRALDLDALLDELWTLLARAARQDIVLERRRSSVPVVIEADPTQMEQVLVNLVVNARDAMPDGGSVVVETRLDASAGRRQAAVGPSSSPTGRWVHLSVADTGTGMSKEVLTRIFEPFFTTKEVGAGTGLGLATVHGVVTQAGGHLEVESEEGRGTTFHLYLPEASAASRVVTPLESPAVVPATVGLRVLVVDDEAMVRRVVVRALQRAHHEVLEAETSQAARELIEQDTPFDLLVTDVVMPGIGGVALAKLLRQKRPEARVLFLSGYSENAGIVVEPGRTAYLTKPFAARQIVNAIAELMHDG